ncbi:MAG TPA: hypothetical protein VHT96_07965 [Clostridia bacterium]|nr:hypothetical protein [Clostridia bacterium]
MINGTAVRIYNAENNRFECGVVRKRDGRYYVDKTHTCDTETGIYLTPGWIDLHAHINDGFGMFGINADDIGYRTGVCMVADAGTTGDYTIGGFRKYVEPTIKTNIKLFICISPIGVIFNHEYNAMEYLNAGNTVRTIEANRDIICGVKVRIASGVIRHEGIEPLRIASEAAGITGLPLMVHIGGNPPYLSDIEPYLKKGDILTHCFNGSGDVWNEDGTPSKPLQRLIERGIILDVGHGAGSFSFDVCRKAFLRGIPKISISTDLHAYSRNHPVHDMATTLTKMLALSMPLEDIMYGVTKLPAEILCLENWCDLSELRNATFFRIDSVPDEYTDSCGKSISFSKRIVPSGVIINGEFYDL